MRFKIDTRERFRILTIEGDKFDANLAAEITSALQLTDASSPESLIIDLHLVTVINEKGVEEICNIYRHCYARQASCCLAVPPSELIKILKQKELRLNIASSLPEAIDVVMMEEVERELFNEDDDENG
jgi:anti-anti-sigma regulatory factor